MGDEMFRSIKQKIDGFELVKPNLESFFTSGLFSITQSLNLKVQKEVNNFLFLEEENKMEVFCKKIYRYSFYLISFRLKFLNKFDGNAFFYF